MAGLHLTLQRLRLGQTWAARVPLNAERLARPVAEAGERFVRLQGGPGDARWSCGWHVDGDEAGTLRVEARDPTTDQVLWTGRVPVREHARIARRAAVALAAVGVWPRSDEGQGDRLVYEWWTDERDPTVHRPRPLDLGRQGPVTASALGIECEAATAAPAPAIVEPSRLQRRQTLRSAADPDACLWIAPAVWDAIEDLLDDSARSQEERALLLYGTRFRLPGTGSEDFVPLFVVDRHEEPPRVQASATHLVLEHSSLLFGHRPGEAAIGLLHTHLPGYSLDTSDCDLRDLEDLDCGGSSFSAIFHARERSAEGEPGFAVHARLGRHGGVVAEASVEVAVGELAPGRRERPSPVAARSTPTRP